MEINNSVSTRSFCIQEEIMKVIKLLVNGELQEFLVQDGLAELIKAMDLKEIGANKIRKAREVKMRDIPKDQWDKIALQSYWEDENKEGK